MQLNNKLYNPELHDKLKVLVLNQNVAEKFINPSRKDSNGDTYGVFSIEIRHNTAKYRGTVYIGTRCNNSGCGEIIGSVELCDIVPIRELDPEEWVNTRLNRDMLLSLQNGHAWKFRNPRRCIEMPLIQKRGFKEVVYNKDEIMNYPDSLMQFISFKE